MQVEYSVCFSMAAGNGVPLDPLAVSILIIKSLESLSEPLFTLDQCFDLLELSVATQTLEVRLNLFRATIECMPETKRGEWERHPQICSAAFVP